VNDLDLLERFRAETPEPDDLWLRELRRRITSDTPSADPLLSGRRRRPTFFLTAAAVVIAALIVAGSFVLPEGAPAAPDPAVADVLRRFSRIAVRAPAEQPPQPGQYVYWKTRETATYLFFPGPGLEPFAYQVSGVGERWVGLDGSGRSREEFGQPVFLTDSDRRAYEAFLEAAASEAWGEFDWGTTYEDSYRPGELSTGRDISALPTDPQALRTELERQESLGGSNGDWGVFTWAVDMLAESHMSPELRSAFFEVMSTIPGTELIGPIRDNLGRRGIAIGHTRDGVREEVVFDRRTGDILSIRTVRVEDDPGAGDDVGQNPCCGEFAWAGTEAGTVMFESTFLIEGVVVDSIPERPDESS
jgi:hypothetical protein